MPRKELELTERQIDRQDCVDSIIYELINKLSPETDIEWDIEDIAEVRDVIQGILVDKLKVMNAMEFYPYVSEECHECEYSHTGWDNGAVARAHNMYGGSTFSMKGENMDGKDFYAVAVLPKRSRIISGAVLNECHICKFVRDNAEYLANLNLAVGTWYDLMSDQSELDLVYLAGTRRVASMLAEDYDQKAYYDLSSGQEIRVKGDTNG